VGRCGAAGEAAGGDHGAVGDPVAAKANGVKYGSSPKLTPHQQREALARPEAGESQSTKAGFRGYR
jgi:hypothetical protein